MNRTAIRRVLSIAAFAAATLAQDAPKPEMSPRAQGLTPADRAVLQSPEFQRRLAESYLADSEIEPKLGPVEREALSKVMQLISAEKLEEAKAELAAISKPDTSAVYDFTLGNLCYQQEKIEDASKAYQVAVAKFPKFRRAWANLGQIQYREGDFKSARRSFARVIELGGGDAVLFGLLGVCHSRCSDDLSSESAFRMASLLAPDTLDWKMGLAESMFRQRRFADAASLFRSMTEQSPERADLWKFEGEAQAMLGETMRAIECFEMATRLGGASAPVCNNLGDLYASQQLFDLAVASYLAALGADPKAKTERALRAAKFLCANGALSEARLLVDGVEQKRPELSDADKKQVLSLRASVAVAQGASAEEAAALEKLVELDPLDGNSLILLGKFQERAGNVEQAVFQFERAAGVAAFEAQAKLSHGQLLVRQGKFQEALPLLRRAVELQPKEAWQKYLEQVEGAARQR
jgi:tetratricopeptide (TPR) repeat protein